MSGGGVIENIAGEGCLRRFAHKMPEPLGGIFVTVQEKSIDRRIAHGQLCRVQIPALVQAVDERMGGMPEGGFPGIMDDLSVFRCLLRRQIFAPVRSDGHDVGRPVGEHDAGVAERHFGKMVGKIAHRMPHRLVFCGDSGARRES